MGTFSFETHNLFFPIISYFLDCLVYSFLGLYENAPATSWKYLHSNQIIAELLKG